MRLKSKYGSTALVAGASEGLGAAYSSYLAAQGMDLIVIARRMEPLQQMADLLMKEYSVKITCIACDLSESNAVQSIQDSLNGKEVDVFVYNAALSYIGPFEKDPAAHNRQIATANIFTPMQLTQLLGAPMLERGKGAVILMASLAGFQGSGFLSVYAASKAFIRIFAESLWYEWKNRGVDVIACCAGAISTPNFINTNPGKPGFFAPRVQAPEEVVKECFKKLGRQPSFISGAGNKMAMFIMQKIMPHKVAVNIMGDTTKKIYRL